MTLTLTGLTLLQSGKGAGGAATVSATAPLSASLERQAAASCWACEGGNDAGGDDRGGDDDAGGAGVGAGGCAGVGFVSGIVGRTGGKGAL
jgi:hypothetical protein